MRVIPATAIGSTSMVVTASAYRYGTVPNLVAATVAAVWGVGYGFWRRGARGNMNARLLRFTMILAGLLCASCAFAGNSCKTCYIDYENGSDSWDGTAKTHTGGSTGPWKHLPGMNGSGDNCTGNCASQSPVAGDKYVLKGGVVWPYTAFPLHWTWNGSGTTGSATYGCSGSGCITVTVDPSWNKGIVNSVSLKRDLGTCPSAGVTATISGGGGNGAAATPVMVGGQPYFGGGVYLIGYFQLASQGSGYTSAPSVNVSGGNCVVQAVADIQRAVFDLGGASGNWTSMMSSQANVVHDSGDYTVFDNIEVRSFQYNISEANSGIGIVGGGHHTTFSNLFIHNWAPNQNVNGQADGMSPLGCGNDPNCEAANVTIGNGEQTFNCGGNASMCGWGDGFNVGGSVHDSQGYFLRWLVRGALLVHDNELWAGTSSSVGAHNNAIYTSVSPGTVITIYNNVTHSCATSQSQQMSQGTNTTWYVFNNVQYGCAGGGTIWGIDTRNPAPSGNSYYYFWNNTWYTWSGDNATFGTAACVNAISGPNDAGVHVSLYNNQCITDQTGSHWYVFPSDFGSVNGGQDTSGTKADTANLVMTPASASQHNYVTATLFQPMSGTSLTASPSSPAGVNLTAASPGCGVLPALCSDILGNKRPGSGMWNLGAYWYTGKPIAPISLVAAPH